MGATDARSTVQHVVVVCVLGGISGCSLTTVPFQDCTTHAECREAFGFGYECGIDEGLCRSLEVHPRCTDTHPEDLFTRPEDYSDVVVIGTLFDHETDYPEVKSARLAVALVQASPLEGQGFAMVHCTYETDNALDALDYPEAVAETAVWLADNLGSPAVVGPATSGQSEAAYYALEPYRTLMISPSATSPALTDIDGITKTDEEPGQFWRTAPPDSFQGKVVALDMEDRFVQNVAVIYQSGPYGGGLAEAFEVNFSGDTQLYVFSDGPSRDDAVATVGQLSDLQVEEVFFISSEISDIQSFLNGASLLSGYDNKGIFLADGAADSDLFDGTEGATSLYDNIRGTRPAQPEGIVWDFFVTNYAGQYGEDPATSIYTAYAHDAAWLALYGAAWSRSQEGEITGLGMARGLRRISAGTHVSVGLNDWATVKARFSEGDTIDVEGTSGPLDYDPDTEETEAAFEVWGIVPDGGDWAFEALYRLDPE